MFSLFLLKVGALMAGAAGALRFWTGARMLASRPTVQSGRIAQWLLWATAGLLAWSLLMRWSEAGHFPSQTMYEVLGYCAFMTVVSTAVLVYVLDLNRTREVGGGMGHLLLGAALIGACALVWFRVLGLDTGDKNLPPALQSYWFIPHITALIFSYVTLTIAYLAALAYFGLVFARGLFEGGVPRGKMWAIGLFTWAPFAFVVNVPVVLGCIGLHAWARRRGWAGQLDGWLAGVDDFTYRIFSTGFPFLTAGLMMGALWAQEAWANYWGWDSKEVSALISWLVYVCYLHLRWVGGWRGEKGLWILLIGAVSILITFQLFGYLPESVDSLHKYTGDFQLQAGGEGGAAEGRMGTGLEGG